MQRHDALPTISLTRLRGNAFAQWGLFAVPLLLLIAPALYYSLDTPIGLLERSPQHANRLHSASDFLGFLHNTLTEPQGRFRPFFYVWNGLVWKVFGDLAWPHHLIRWLICFGAVALFIAAFRRFQGKPHTAAAAASGGLLRIVPAALLAYLWLLFPSPVIVRIECVELYTIFFLGLCNWAAALMLTAEGGKPASRRHALFCLGFLGLVFSKEVNVAPALWLLVCYWAFVIAQGASAKRLLAGSALTLTLAFAIHKVGESLALAEQYGEYFKLSKPILERFTENSMDILQGLFQYETSVVIAAVFAFLLAALIVSVVAKVARRELGGELAFVFLLLGEFVSMFLVLSIQYDITLRYWSILVPCLAALLAFAAKFLLQAAMRRKALANCAALALAVFVAFFAAANHYSFLYQVVTYHNNRNLDDLLMREVAKLLNNGEYIEAHSNDWDYEAVHHLNHNFYYRKYWPNSPYGDPAINRKPPKDAQQPYYLVDILGQPGLVALDTHFASQGRTDYGVLDWPLRMASLVQGKPPYVRLDWGIWRIGEYRWAMHAVPHGMGGYLEGLIAKAGEPSSDSFYDLYFDGSRIMYVRRPCLDSDIEEFFFLHLHPVAPGDLPEGRKRHGFDNLDFHFRDYGVKDNHLCVAMRTLPQYPIASIRTGQYTVEDGRPIWNAEITPLPP